MAGSVTVDSVQGKGTTFKIVFKTVCQLDSEEPYLALFKGVQARSDTHSISEDRMKVLDQQMQ